MKTALETVQLFQQSLATGTDDWQNLFSDDVVFSGPVDTVKGKTANIELNKGFMPLVQGYEPKNLISEGDLVVMEGTYTIKAPSGKMIKLLTAEVYEILDAKIQNIRIYYDAEEFRKEFTPAQ